MEKLVNEPRLVINELLEGLVRANPNHLRRLEDTNVIVRQEAPIEGKVGIVTGGGSGHEPMHAGYTGPGMLDGAAAGAIFTSPPATEFKELVETAAGGEGVLAIIKNYEGDIMNFETAADLAADVNIKKVIVDDDVSISEATDKTGRRGVCGTIFVHKVAGAKAAQGANLTDVQDAARKAVDNVASMGVALSSCVPPEKGSPTFDLPEDEIELGIGIHGEPGIERTKLETADEVTERLAEPVMDDLNLEAGDDVAIIVNGLGNTPLGELYIVNRKLNEILTDVSVNIVETMVGEYCTSLDMNGCSITLLKLDDELEELLGYPTDTPALTISDD